VLPTTGSTTWDVVLEIGIAICLLIMLVLLWRNMRGR
jgi:LPXTG-motif cell wall-anchored protein